jgi:hypothetical protein
LKNLGYYIFNCTDNEASRLGRFLHELWAVIAQWRDPAIFEKDCLNTPGFRNNYFKQDPERPPITFVTFLKITHKWQKLMTQVAP